MVGLPLYNKYLTLFYQLVQTADKETLAQCARALAMNLANYELHFGPLSLNQDFFTKENPTEIDGVILTIGMDHLISALGGIGQTASQETTH
jgi:hypothetical protein